MIRFIKVIESDESHNTVSNELGIVSHLKGEIINSMANSSQ